MGQKQKTAPPPSRSQNRASTASWEWLIPIVLVLAAALAYSNSFHGPFIYDDVPSIPENPHVRHLWPWAEADSAVPPNTTTGRPVALFSLALNYALGGSNVWGYHAFNVAIHILAALTLYGLVRRTLLRLPGLVTGDAAWLAGSVALIWELHPLTTDAVDYIVQRTELLASLFLLLTLYCLNRGATSKHAWRWYGAGIAACGLGMGSKEIMAGAPLIALLYDRIFLSESWPAVWRSRRFVHLGFIATLSYVIFQVASGVHGETVGLEYHIGPLDYAKTQGGAILHYLRLSAWPSPLSLDYTDWKVPATSMWATPSVYFVAALGGLTLWALYRKPWLGFLGSCFFIVLAPSSSFVPIVTELVAERRMYLPLAAIICLVVVSGYALTRGKGDEPSPWPLVVVAAVALVLGAATYIRNKDYRSELAIWTDVIEKRPNNARGHVIVGSVFAREGRDVEAMDHLAKAVSLAPHMPDATNDLGALLERNGRIQEAIPLYRKAIALKPDFPDARYNLALALHKQGNLDEAEQGYRDVLSRTPGYLAAYNNLAILLLGKGRTDDAVALVREALRRDATFADALKTLAAIEQAQKRR